MSCTRFQYEIRKYINKLELAPVEDKRIDTHLGWFAHYKEGTGGT